MKTMDQDELLAVIVYMSSLLRHEGCLRTRNEHRFGLDVEMREVCTGFVCT